MALASGVRYRYKGKIISAGEAARYNNLRNAKKFITTEYVYKGQADSLRRGYKKPLDAQVSEALAKSRSEAKAKRKDRAPTKAEARRIQAEKKEKQGEQRRAVRFAEDIAELAEREDIDIADALDRVGFDSDDWGYYDAEDMAGLARDYIDFGDEYFDFDMSDLEREDDRKS